MDSLYNDEEVLVSDGVSQSIQNKVRDAAKKRLKALSEKNTKDLNEVTSSPFKVNPAFLSLYSDEELESTDVKEPEIDNNEVKVNNKANEENNVKRLYRTDRTKNTDSELSEGEILDDEDDDLPATVAQKTGEEEKVSKDNIDTSKINNNNDQLHRPAHNFLSNNHKPFDLRQRLQTNRGRFRGNARVTGFSMRDRRNNRLQNHVRRPRSRSRRRHSSKDKKSKSKEKRTPTKTKDSKTESKSDKNDSSERKTEGKKDSKHESHKQHQKKKDKKPKDRLSLEEVKEITTFLPDDDEEIKELKRKIMGLQAELAANVVVNDTSKAIEMPIEKKVMPERQPTPKEATPPIEKVVSPNKTPDYETEKKESKEVAKDSHDKEHTSKSEKDKKKSPKSQEKHSKPNSRRSRTPKSLESSCEVKKTPTNTSKSIEDAEKSKKKVEETPERIISINMSDGSVKKIPHALVNYTTTLPKIIYSPRSNLKPGESQHKLTGETKPITGIIDKHEKLSDNHDKRKTDNSKPKENSNKKIYQSIKPISNDNRSSKGSSDPKKDESRKKDRRDSPTKSKKPVPAKEKSPNRTKNCISASIDKDKDSKKQKETDRDHKKTDSKHVRRDSHRDRIENGPRLDRSSHSDASKKPSSFKDASETHKKTDNVGSSNRSSHLDDKRKSSKERHTKHQISDSKKATESDKSRTDRTSSVKEAKKVDVKPEEIRKPSKDDGKTKLSKDSHNNNRSSDVRMSVKKESRSPVRLDPLKSKSKPKSRQEHKPTLSFADELLEVQGLKPAKDEIPAMPVEKTLKRRSPVPSPVPTKIKEESKTEQKLRDKKSEHAEMLKKIGSKVEEILAPLSEIEKLALDRKSLKPEDLLSKMMHLFTPEKKSVEVAHVDEKPLDIKIVPDLSLYDPMDNVKLPIEPIKVKEPETSKIESEYESYINSLTSDDVKLDENPPVDQVEIPKPKKKKSRSLSQSTSSSHTSGTSSTNNSSSESSSSSDSDSSNTSSSDSDTDSDSSSDASKESKKSDIQSSHVKIDEKKVQVEDKKVVSPSKTPPRELIPMKFEQTVSSTVETREDSGLIPLPDNRESLIKIQMNVTQKVCNIINKHLKDDEEESVFESKKTDDEKKRVSKEKTRKRSRSRSSSQRKSVDSKKSRSSRDTKGKESDNKKRTRTRSRSREKDRRRISRGSSRDRQKRRRTSLSPIRRSRRSRDRSHRRSTTRSPIRRNNSRRLSPRHHRPRSPRTPESPRSNNRHHFSRSRSCSRSPQRRRHNLWNRFDDYRRPPSPQSDTESPVAGFKRSLADSTISDAELEQQQLFKIQTHITTEGFYSYMDPDGHAMAANEMHDSPRRVSLDDRINMALGGHNSAESSKFSYPMNEDYRYNHYQHPGPPVSYQPHHPPQLQYRYDPAIYNAPAQPSQPGFDHNMPHYRYNCQPTMHNAIPPPVRGHPGYDRDFVGMQHQPPRMIKPPLKPPFVPARMPMSNQGGIVQKGIVLETRVPTVIEITPSQTKENVQQGVEPGPSQPKKKLIFTTEELQSRKEKKLELRKKRKAERDKKRLEKKMRKEKLKLEIKRLVSMGVKDEVLSSDEDQPFDDIACKGIYGTKDKGILKAKDTEPAPVKKSVKFADGVLPGDGSSYSDNEQISPGSISEKRKKKMNKRKKQKATTGSDEKKPEQVQELTPFPIESNIPPELEHAEPPAPPEGDPPSDLQQPRYLHPNRVPMLFFHLLRATHYQPPPPHPHHLLPGHPGNNHPNPCANQSPALHMNPQAPPPLPPPPPPQTMNKLTPSSRVNQLPPTFAKKSSMVFE